MAGEISALNKQINKSKRLPPESGVDMKTITLENPKSARRRMCRRRKIFDYGEDYEYDGSDNQGSAKRWHRSASDLEADLMIGILASSGGDAEVEDQANISYRSHGSVSFCGRRREMEDAVAVAPGFFRSNAGEADIRYDFFAVYDGHGGSAVAQACRERLHQLLAEEMEVGGRVGDWKWKEVLESCFWKMDEEVLAEAEAAGDKVAVSAAKMMGSTAVVAVVGTADVVVANCGDSRAVLSRGRVALPLSCDHKVISLRFFFLDVDVVF